MVGYKLADNCKIARAAFPLPVAGVTAKTMLWSWQEVTRWFMDKGKLGDEAVYANAVILKQINESLEMRENELQLKSIKRLTKQLRKSKEQFV